MQSQKSLCDVGTAMERFPGAVFSRPASASLAGHAVRALIEEAELTPKPGLVDRRGSGSHYDLSLKLLITSAETLREYFRSMAEAAQSGISLESLRNRIGRLGREAESAMLEATGGTNTHRGAIWSLGLLVTAAAKEVSIGPAGICRIAGCLAQLPDTATGVAAPIVGEPWRKDANFGARAEAQRGFPHVRAVGLPELQRARAAGVPEDLARVDALLAIMATLSDTCILRRGGTAALFGVQRGARLARERGGVSTLDGAAAFRRLEETMIRLWVSPGGSADLLAATLFLDRLASCFSQGVLSSD